MSRRYVVVVPQGLGDTLEATPMFAALRSHAPKAHVTAVVMRSTARDLVTALPQLVDRVIYLPYWDRDVAGLARVAACLPFGRRADAAFLSYPSARPVYLGLLAAIPARARYAHRYDDTALRRVLSPFVRQVRVEPEHNVLRNLALLRAAGMAPTRPTTYTVPKTWSADRPRPSDRVLMHVGTIAHHGLEARRWPEASFARLGHRLRQRGFSVSLLSGPAEREATLRVAAELPGVPVLGGTLDESARHIANATAFVANDNGLAHVAAGVGTPVLALFGPTPVEHGPFGPNAVAFRPSSCPPCFSVATTDTTCKRHIDYACLKGDLDVDAVERRLLELVRDAYGASVN